MMTDVELLHRFVELNDQAAFAELVHRHLNLVYGAALRHVPGDNHQAEDITQQVFVDLARKAHDLLRHPCLAGWLYTSTRLIALPLRRSERRRTKRENQGQLMTDSSPEPQWNEIRPVIDDALADLNERERRGVLLRFFANHDYRAVGEQLGLTENAAQKLVGRALDHLNAALSRRGITSTSAALTVALGSSAATAPVTLSSLIIAAAPSAAVTTLTTSSLFMISAKIALLAVTAGLGFGSGVLYQHPSKRLPTPAPPPTPISQTQPEPSELQHQLAQATKRAELAEEDNTRLLDAIQRFKANTTPPAPAARPVSSQPRPSGSVPYVIRPRDTLAVIAQLNGVAVRELLLANPEIDWARLKVGQEIRLP